MDQAQVSSKAKPPGWVSQGTPVWAGEPRKEKKVGGGGGLGDACPGTSALVASNWWGDVASPCSVGGSPPKQLGAQSWICARFSSQRSSAPLSSSSSSSPGCCRRHQVPRGHVLAPRHDTEPLAIVFGSPGSPSLPSDGETTQHSPAGRCIADSTGCSAPARRRHAGAGRLSAGVWSPRSPWAASWHGDSSAVSWVPGLRGRLGRGICSGSSPRHSGRLPARGA